MDDYTPDELYNLASQAAVNGKATTYEEARDWALERGYDWSIARCIGVLVAQYRHQPHAA